MLGSHPSRWLIFLVSGALTALGCVGTTDTGPQGETGSLSVDLVLADGLVIDELGWQITGNGMDMSGDVDVSAPGSTASVEVFGLPPGETDYTVTLTATSNDENVTCEGSAPFNVEVGQSTDVMVMLNCKKPRTLGGVRVNGKFNVCTQLTKTVVSPLQTSVGNDISLAAQAFDEEGDAISYSWTGTGGSIADPTAASTTYTCQDVGEHTVTIRVTDNDMFCNMATWTVPVTCVEGDGGDLCEDVMCEDDGNECTVSECNPANGLCETSNVADGTECDGGTCSGGACVVVDLCEGVDCNDDLECTADACDPANGTCSNSNVENGTPCADDTGMCVDGSCMVADLCDGVVCDDTGNECTVAMCNTTTGVCETMNVTDGTECNGGAGACSAGVCIDNNPCQGVDCTSDNDCVQDGTCDPADGLCDPGDPQPADTACDLAGTDDGFCDGAGACVGCNANTQCPDDGNECTAETCTSNACSSSPVADGTVCDADGSAGVCMSGVCEDAMLCADAETRCSDGNECTQDLCDPATGDCSNPAEPDGSQCTCPVCGAEGVCDMGVCIDPCDGVDCSDGNQCTADLCNVGVCSNPNVGPGAACDQDGGNVCDGAGTCVECNDENDCDAGEACIDNACEAAADSVVCEQFNPTPAQTGQNCDGSTGQECICEKAEFLAIDCELIGNSAPLPLQASAQQFGIATAGSPVSILPQDAIVLAADLICGFIGAGFQSALVADSDILATYTNADIASSALKSFLATASSGGDLISPHGEVFFNFGTACGDNCSGSPLTCDDGTTPCTLATFTTDCSQDNGGSVGTGTGIVAPFFANAPGSIPPGPIPNQLVSLTPTAAGSVDIGLPYSGIALELPDVGGLASGCAGGACRGTCAITSGVCASNADCPGGAADTCNGILCATLARGAETSPRVMYDATCNKLGFAACGGTECLADADCPFNAAAISPVPIPGQTCVSNLCTDVNTGSCGFAAPGLCPDGATSCGSCSDADDNTGICSVSGFPCAVDIDCPFGVADLCGAPTACAVDADCTAPFGTCVLSDDRCNPVIEAISGGAVSTCCSPFGFFTSTADVCKDKLPPEDKEVAPPCCNQLLPNPAGTNKDVFCENPTNKASCCAAIATEFPLATPAQNPQLWVNP